jgi:hypothetical protein
VTRAAALVLGLLVLPTAFSVDGRQSVHARITREALDFLRPAVRDLIEEANKGEDKGDSYDFPERHFSNCLFRESVSYVNARYRVSVAALAQGDTKSGAAHFGMLLHGVQDFYAHSAWVDPAPIGLGFGKAPAARIVESGTGPWVLAGAYQPFRDTDIVIVQDDPPPGVTIDLPRDGGGRPMSAVPMVTIGGRRYRGLMTSTAGPISFATQRCPPVGDDCWSNQSVCIRHAEPQKEPEGADAMKRCLKETPEIYENCFHHDDPRRPRYDEAVAAAIRQTAHEWCRLLHLTRADTAGRAAGLALALWVLPPADLPPHASPHPVGTPCAPESRGTVTATLDLPVVNQSGADRYVAVLYTRDFRRSTRVQFRNGARPQPLVLCIAEGEDVVAGVWGWRGGEQYEPGDPVVAVPLPAPPVTGSRRCAPA